MDTKWSLDELYTSFDSPEYKQDFDNLIKTIDHFKAWTEESLPSTDDAAHKMETYISMDNEFETYTKLVEYASLVLSVDTVNERATKALDVLEELLTELSKPSVMFQNFVGKIDNLDEIIDSSELLQTHRFFLQEVKISCKYLLSEKEEVLLAKMKNTGSGMWAKLREQLTSTFLVDIEINGEARQEPLSVVRNYAYESDAPLRKTAYEAELKAYEKIDKSVCFALNGVKGETLTTSKLRGYQSPLEMTLIHSRMSRETLDAMLTAIREYLPVFRRYLRKKAEMLGHGNGLPFYDLFAPMGEVHMTFTYDEAADFVIKNFTDFSQKLGDYATKAFQNRWIDALPAAGKTGGAFCANLHVIKQSRILSNFTGSFSDVITLAHELGHGYHGECLNGQTYVNSHYPMPIAETASTFCETIVNNAAIKMASQQEAFVITESSISDITQVIVDIYSRFLFEDEVFNRRKDGSLSVSELNEIMLESQRQSYGDGLDTTILHPYMWVCKPHYYYADDNYYNFPYAFGLLLAKGLYAKYLTDGDAFVAKYDDFLSMTGKNNLDDIGKLMNISLTQKDFWESSLKMIAGDIEKFF